MRVFLDANILFSATKSDGAVRALLRRLIDRGHACCVDAYVLAEARRNLVAKGPEASAALETLLTHLELASAGQGTMPGEGLLDWLPETDRPVPAAAIRLGCDALVTGHHTHVGAGYRRTFGGVTIHSPRALAERPLG